MSNGAGELGKGSAQDAVDPSARPQSDESSVAAQATRRLSTFWRRGATILDQATKWAILFAVANWVHWHFFVRDGEQRAQSVRESWVAIYQSKGQGGDGGRREALETLHRFGENLSHVDISSAYLAGAELDGVVLANANIESASFSGAKLFGADLSGAVLRSAKLDGADLRRATLEGSDLSNATLSGTSLEGANLKGANLKGANLEGTSLPGTVLTGANLEGANVAGAALEEAVGLTLAQVFSARPDAETGFPSAIAAELKRRNITAWTNGGTLTRAGLEGLDLSAAAELSFERIFAARRWDEKTIFPPAIRAELEKRRIKSWGNSRDIRGADLSGLDLRGAMLRDSDLEGADLTRATLRDANLWGTNLREAALTGADLHGAELEGTFLEKATGLKLYQLLTAKWRHPPQLPRELQAEIERRRIRTWGFEDYTDVDLSGLKLHGRSFENTKLESANLDGTDLRDANLARANLAKASLLKTDLDGTDLSGAVLSDANGLEFEQILRARWDESTQFPAPLAAELQRRKIRTWAPGASLVDANLSGLTIRGRNAFERVERFRGSDLTRVDFSGSTLRGVDFSQSNLSGANFRDAVLEDSVFVEADVTAADFAGADLQGAIFCPIAPGSGRRHRIVDPAWEGRAAKGLTVEQIRSTKNYDYSTVFPPPITEALRAAKSPDRGR